MLLIALELRAFVTVIAHDISRDQSSLRHVQSHCGENANARANRTSHGDHNSKNRSDKVGLRGNSKAQIWAPGTFAKNPC